MEEHNVQVSKIDNDDECTSTYKRAKIDEFLKAIIKDDSRFFLPPDENGRQMLAITIQDILNIYRKTVEGDDA